jgi:hypothetical protein
MSWSPGDVIPVGRGVSYVVVSVVPATVEDELRTLVVREE